MNDTTPRRTTKRFRVRIGLVVMFIGWAMFVLGVNPDLFRMDRSSVTGFVQITVFLIGLAMICLGGYVTLNVLWNGSQKTIIADIGVRLVSTGYVIALASGMADIFGFGSQLSPMIPSFGQLQATGVMLGEVIIAIGFVLVIPPPGKKFV